MPSLAQVRSGRYLDLFKLEHKFELELKVELDNYCRAQRSGARPGDRDVAPVAALQSRPRERQMYVTVLVPGCPPQVCHT